MSTFLLVHGSAHGAWCWDKLVPILVERGHRAIAADLPGMGADRTRAADVSMKLWVEFISALARKEGEPVLLVGHSRGGTVISEAAEWAPEAFSGLIYIAGLMLPNGATIMDALKGFDPPSMQISMAPDRTASLIQDPAAKEVFYNRASLEDAEWAFRRLGPDPIAPGLTPATVTDGRWGRLPRAYIECTDDRAITIEAQRAMQAKLPCDLVITLDSDHSPFLCMPAELADSLEMIASKFQPG